VVYSSSVIDSHELLIVDFNLASRSFRVILVYRVPSLSKQLSSKIWEIIDDFSGTYLPLVLLGDFNLPEIKWPVPNNRDLTPTGRDFINLCQTSQFTQIVNEPTRGDAFLDLIAVRDDCLVGDVTVVPPVGTSDHSAIEFSMSIQFTKYLYTYKKDFNAVNYDLVNAELCSVDWNNIFCPMENIQVLYTKFLDVIHNLIDTHVPLQKVSLSGATLPDHILRKMKKKNDAWRTWILSRSDSSKKQYEKSNLTLERALKQFNKTHEKRIIERRDKRAFNKYLNQRMKSKKVSVDTLLDNNGRHVAREDSKAELLAQAFSTVFTQDDGILPDLPGQTPPVMHRDPYTMFARHKLCAFIEKWKSSSNATPENINLKFIKKIAVPLSIPLEMLFVISFQTCELPREWKESTITPLRKKEPFTNPLNYRPISVTSYFARLFEKCIAEELTRECEELKILPDCQDGFRPHRSTELLMLKSLNDWHKNLALGKATDVIYFDYAKAFDSVNHKKLAAKLYNRGFAVKLVEWIVEFLSHRKFSVKIGDHRSRQYDVVSGVPQGTVLGPILFIIFTSELPSIIKDDSITIRMFADDTKIYRSFEHNESGAPLQTAIDAISTWSSTWQLKLEASKCQHLCIGEGRTFAYYIAGALVPQRNNLRDLGFTIQTNLSFKLHIEAIAKSALLKMKHVLRVLYTSNSMLLTRAYKTYVRPLLEYGSVVWSPFHSKEIECLEKVQKFATRAIMYRCFGFNFDNRPGSTDRNQMLQLSTLLNRRRIRDMQISYEIIFGITPISVHSNEFFVFRKSTTRGSKFVIDCQYRAKTQTCQNSYAFRAVRNISRITHECQLPIPYRDFMKFVENFTNWT